MHTLLVIVGPTGVGKSALCMKVAKHFNVPIINADSRQLYKELPIGTAAPTIEDQREVKHYFVGNLSITDYFSASMFEMEVLKILSECFKHFERSNHSECSESSETFEHSEPTSPAVQPQGSPLALLSGGSMMYVDAVCNGIDDIPTVEPEIRAEIIRRYETEGLEKLRAELRMLDPEYYEIVDLKNPKRIMHALEICYQAGRTYTSFRTNQKKERPFRIIKIGLDRPREELYDRINRRVLQMMEAGLEEEARKVFPYRTLNSLNTVGYKEMFQYFDGVLTKEEAIERIQANSRKYARKQLTWFRRDKDIRWFNPEMEDEIIEFIESKI